MTKNKVKKAIDNYHTTMYDVTQKALFTELENAKPGDMFKIDYTKVLNRSSKKDLIIKVFNTVNDLRICDLSNKKGFKAIDEILSKYQGEQKSAYYKRAEDLRNASGYILMQDENDNWKSIDIRNITSLITSNGIRLVRYAQEG